MTLEEAQRLGRLANEIRDLTGLLAWYDEQESADRPVPSPRVVQWEFATAFCGPSPAAATAARAILRADFQAQLDQLVAELSAVKAAA